MSGEGDEAERLQVLEKYRKKVRESHFFVASALNARFRSARTRHGRPGMPFPLKYRHLWNTSTDSQFCARLIFQQSIYLAAGCTSTMANLPRRRRAHFVNLFVAAALPC